MKKIIVYICLILGALSFSACTTVPKTPLQLEIEIKENIKDRYGLPKFKHIQKGQGYGEVMTANGYRKMFVRFFDSNDDAPALQSQDLGLDVVEYGQPIKYKNGDMAVIPLIRVYDKNFDGKADIMFLLINDEPRAPKYLRRKISELLDMKIENFIKFNPTLYQENDKKTDNNNYQLIE